MKINVSGKHLDVGDALQSHIETHLNDIVEKFFGHGIDASIVLSHAPHHKFKAEILVNIGHGIRIRGKGECGEAYSAADKAIERITTQLKKYKNRLKNHHLSQSEKNAQDIMAQSYTISGEDSHDNDNDNKEDAQPLVIAEEATYVPELTVKEAVMRLDLEDCQTMMFINKAHGKLNAVYKRIDGNIGWIDPKL